MWGLAPVYPLLLASRLNLSGFLVILMVGASGCPAGAAAAARRWAGRSGLGGELRGMTETLVCFYSARAFHKGAKNKFST